MKVSIVLVKPEYPMNIGYVARAMKNFGSNELILINPVTDHLNGDAKSRAMKGVSVLRNAKISSSLEKSLTKFDYCIATSARLSSPNKLSRSVFTPKQLASEHANTNSKIAIVFGSEKTGLTNEEIALCDGLVHISSSPKYPVLNLGHAVSVILYELYNHKQHPKKKTVSKATKEKLLELFCELAENAEGFRQPAAAKSAFRSWLAKSPLTDKEAKTVLAVFDKTLKSKEKSQKINMNK